MNIVGHYLDLTTGDELPIVAGHIIPEGVSLSDDSRLELNLAEYGLNGCIGCSCKVAMRFVPNPAAEKAPRQMNYFTGPSWLPSIAAVCPEGVYLYETWHVRQTT